MSDYTLYRTTGDPEAFNRMVAQHQGMVFGIALRVLNDHHMAEDVVQETFMALARQSARIEKTVASWLYAAARNRAIDRLRSECSRKERERQTQQIPVSVGFSVDAETDPEAMRQAIDEVLLTLQDTDREILLRRYIEGQARTAVARDLGISDVAIGKRERKALELMRRRLAQRLGSLTLVLLLAGFKEMSAAPSTAMTQSLQYFGLAGPVATTGMPMFFYWVGATIALAGLLGVTVLSWPEVRVDEVSRLQQPIAGELSQSIRILPDIETFFQIVDFDKQSQQKFQQVVAPDTDVTRFVGNVQQGEPVPVLLWGAALPSPPWRATWTVDQIHPHPGRERDNQMNFGGLLYRERMSSDPQQEMYRDDQALRAISQDIVAGKSITCSFSCQFHDNGRLLLSVYGNGQLLHSWLSHPDLLQPTDARLVLMRLDGAEMNVSRPLFASFDKDF